MKCGPLANDSAVLIFAVALLDASIIFFSSFGVFLIKLPLVNGLDSHTSIRKKIDQYVDRLLHNGMASMHMCHTYLYPP